MRLSQSEIEIITVKAFDRGVRHGVAGGDGENHALREAVDIVRDELEKAGVPIQQKRRAVVIPTAAATLGQVQHYLPGNYGARITTDDHDILIEGYDRAGWTLDGYVIPRLASGLIVAKEVSLMDHLERVIDAIAEAFGVSEPTPEQRKAVREELESPTGVHDVI